MSSQFIVKHRSMDMFIKFLEDWEVDLVYEEDATDFDTIEEAQDKIYEYSEEIGSLMIETKVVPKNV